MRFLLLCLSLLLLTPATVYSQQHYSEGACILLLQQIDRFSHQPQNSNYRNAKREYERNCNRPPAPKVNTTPSRNTAPVNVTVTPKAAAVPAKPLVQPEVEMVQPEVEIVSPEVEITAAAPPGTEAENNAAEPPLPDTPAAVTDTAMVQPDTAATPQQLPLPAAEPVVVAQDTVTWLLKVLLPQLFYNLPLIAANLFALLLAVFLLTSWFGLNLPGFKGVFAEYKLNRLLRWQLPRQYQHFRKLKLLTAKDEPVLIDHLVLSPYGIFVITVKGDRGRIIGSETQANWQRQYFGRTKALMNPLHQNFKNVEAVKHFLQLRNTDLLPHLHSVVAFSRVAQFASEMPDNVTYVDAVSGYLKQFSQPCVSEEQLNRFAALLKQASTDG